MNVIGESEHIILDKPCSDQSSKLKVQLVENVPEGVVTYFPQSTNNGFDIAIKITCKFPHQSLWDHYFYIGIDNVQTFTDDTKFTTCSLSEIPYDVMNCYLCMDTEKTENDTDCYLYIDNEHEEKQLYTHEETPSLQFHQQCYNQMKNAIESVIKDNSNHLTAIQI